MNTLSRLLLVCLSISSMAIAQNDWNNQPLMKRASNEQSQNSSKKVSKASVKKNKDSKNKQAVAWYKRPSTKYAAGFVVSAALTGYAVLQHMRAETLPEQDTRNGADQNKSDTTVVTTDGTSVPGENNGTGSVENEDSSEKNKKGENIAEQTTVNSEETLSNDEEQKRADGMAEGIVQVAGGALIAGGLAFVISNFVDLAATAATLKAFVGL